MSLRRNDAYATLLVAAIGVVYALWLTDNPLPGLHSVRMTALAIFVLGAFACGNAAEGVQQLAGRGGIYAISMSVLGAVALLAGITAVIVGSEVILAIFVGSIGLLWLATTIRHATTRAPAQPLAAAPEPRELVHH